MTERQKDKKTKSDAQLLAYVGICIFLENPSRWEDESAGTSLMNKDVTDSFVCEGWLGQSIPSSLMFGSPCCIARRAGLDIIVERRFWC